MPRTARASVSDICYHVLNRGNGRQRVFRRDDDYAAFLDLLAAAAIGRNDQPKRASPKIALCSASLSRFAMPQVLQPKGR